MRVFVGEAILPRISTELRYYVIGTPKKGFVAKIVCSGQNHSSALAGGQWKDEKEAVAFVRILARETVYPEHLADILRDSQVDGEC